MMAGMTAVGIRVIVAAMVLPVECQLHRPLEALEMALQREHCGGHRLPVECQLHRRPEALEMALQREQRTATIVNALPVECQLHHPPEAPAMALQREQRTATIVGVSAVVTRTRVKRNLWKW